MKKEAGFVIIFFFLFFISHLFIWFFLAKFNFPGFFSIFSHWDSNLYAVISEHYYRPYVTDSGPNPLFAFFPLWPFIVGSLGRFFFSAPSPENFIILGSLLSITFFALFLFFVYRTKDVPAEMRPQTWWGWFFLIFSPASYIFHTNHTESLFLLLSWLAFFFAVKGHNIPAAFFSGFCALIKNQGIVTSLVVAFISARIARKNKILTFLSSGFISFLLFLPWPVFQFFTSHSPLSSLDAQKHWQHAHGFLDYLWTWLYNLRYTIQPVHGLRSLRALLFYIGIGVSIFLIFYAKKYFLYKEKKINMSFYFGLYIFLCSAMIPFQGYLENTLRFHLILFPLWFVLGDGVSRFFSSSLKSKKKSFLAAGLLLSLMIALNFALVYNYGLNRWAY